MLTLDLSELLDPAQIKPTIIIAALGNVMERFYSSNKTSIVYIMEQSTLTESNGLKPIEVAGEWIRMERNRILMTYIIENHVISKRTSYKRFYNIFIIDNFESFK